jgi:monofunctional biosynthetic peptidoglycan transglycosylase
LAASKSKFRRGVRLFLWALLVLPLIPPLQVAALLVWNPKTSPMQMQRKFQAWRAGKKLPDIPIRWVPLKDTPKDLVHFIWASEDQNFFKHHGFDFSQLQKAIADAQEDGGSVRGASTITMQCARTVFLWQGRSYVRKALEFYYTFWMELLMSKRRILELYLNHIELGNGLYGIGAAAETYFGKAPGQLTRGQMMALAAILPNPREWSPVTPGKTVRKKIRRIERLSSRAPFPDKELP